MKEENRKDMLREDFDTVRFPEYDEKEEPERKEDTWNSTS